MSDDPKLKALIRQTLIDEGIDGVVETGTYDGMGSTRMLAESFKGLKPPAFFYTCDVNLSKFKRARKNLVCYPFVKCLWGRSVKLNEAIEFMRNDEMLNHHERYPNLFIDWTEDPVAHYIAECRRGFLSHKRALAYGLRFPLYNILGIAKYEGEDLLRKLLRRHANENILISLDSADGIGFLEFNIVRDMMKDREYFLLLDDIKHVKHFRSFEQVKADASFHVVGYDTACGWALSKHVENSY